MNFLNGINVFNSEYSISSDESSIKCVESFEDLKNQNDLKDGQIIRLISFRKNTFCGGGLYKILKIRNTNNVLKFNNFSQNVNGVDITFLENGDIILDGTCNSGSGINKKFFCLSVNPATKSNTTYTATYYYVSGSANSEKFIFEQGITNIPAGSMIQLSSDTCNTKHSVNFTTNDSAGEINYFQIMCKYNDSFDNLIIHMQIEEGNQSTDWENGNFSESVYYNFNINEEFCMQPVVQNNTIDITQLGYLPNKQYQDCHNAITAFIQLCKRDSKQYTLFIPAGKWCFSETNISNGRLGLRIEGISPQSAGAEDETIIMPFNDNQEYIWNFGYDNHITRTLIGGLIIKNLTFSSGAKSDTKFYKNFCSTAVQLNECCYSEFDGLYFKSVNGSGLRIYEGWENKFGYLNFRGVGYISKTQTYHAMEFLAHPQGSTPSAVSANYFDYINFEGTSGCAIYCEQGCNLTHSEFNDIQAELTFTDYCPVEDGITISYTDTRHTVDWNDKDPNIEHIYLIKGIASNVSYNTISVSDGYQDAHIAEWTDEDGTKRYRILRRCGIFGPDDNHYRRVLPSYDMEAMVGKLSCSGGMPIYHSANIPGIELKSGFNIRVGLSRGVDSMPFQVEGKTCTGMCVNDKSFRTPRYKEGYKYLFPRNFYSGNGAKEMTYVDGCLDDCGLALSHGYVQYLIDASKIVKIRLYIDRSIDEFTSYSPYTEISNEIDTDLVSSNPFQITKEDVLLKKYPLKEWFEYEIPNANMPATKFSLEIRTHKKDSGYLDCLMQSAKSREYTYYELMSKPLMSTPNGITVYCKDRRENDTDSLGVFVYRCGDSWRTYKGTDIKSLLKIETESVTVPESSYTMRINGFQQITPTITPEENSYQTTYTSSDKTVCIVRNDGLVRALSAGTATITVKSSNKTATVSITVLDEYVTDYITTDKFYEMTTKTNAQIVAEMHPANDIDTFTYASDNTSICTVDSAGLITPVKKGVTYVTITAGFATKKVKVYVDKA